MGKPGAMTSSPPSRWKSLAPDWKAALVVTVFLGLLGFLSDLLPGLGFILSIPFTILVYYIQGVLVGFYARRNLAYHRKKFWLLGMKSGLWASLVIGSIFTLIALAIQYTLTLGTALVLIPLIITQSLFEIVMNVTFSGLGAWLYSLIGGARMLWISAGVVGCGTLLASGLALLLAIILAWLGIQIIKDLFHSMPILMIDTSAWTLVVHLVA